MLTRATIIQLLLVLAAYACLPACSHSVYFRPREHATGESPGGIPAAEYQLDQAGEMLLWSQGGWREDGDDGDEQSVIHFGLEVENDSEELLEIVVDEFRLRIRLEDGRSIGELMPVELDGEVEIAPGTSSELHMWFAAPDLDSPRDIEALDLHWLLRLRTEANTEFRGSTKFRRDYGGYARYGYRGSYGYYRPYGYSYYWGYGRYCR